MKKLMVISSLLLVLGCDFFKSDSATEMSCTKMWLTSLGVVIYGLSEEELSVLELRLRDEIFDGFNRRGNVFSSETNAWGKMNLVGKLGKKTVIDKEFRIHSDEQGCHASPQSLTYNCQKNSGVVSCAEVVR